jgi:hypothetical protein
LEKVQKSQQEEDKPKEASKVRPIIKIANWPPQNNNFKTL